LEASERTSIERLWEAGVKTWTTTMRGAQPADSVDLAGPVAFIIGNEGNGVPFDLVRKADGALTIPCPGPVESLNAAVAASILLYEAARQRSFGSGGPLAHRRGAR
jgi:TrmH family RNA methyltransferase